MQRSRGCEGSWKLIGNGKEPRFLGNLDDEKPETVNYLNTKGELVQQLLQKHSDWLEETLPR